MNSMYRNFRRTGANIFVALLAAIALGGCAETSRPQATGKGNIRSINGILSSPEITFRVEERTQALLAFKAGNAVRFDDLSYNINFDILFSGDSEFTRLASQPLDVVANVEHIVSIYGSLSSPSVSVWQQPERIWEGTETVFEVSFGHLASAVGELDVYFNTVGTAPAAGNSRGRIGLNGFIPAAEFSGGDYQLILTEPDQPANIVYTSPTTTAVGGFSVTYVIFDPDPSRTGPFGVHLMRSEGGSTELPDQNSPPTVRTYHAALGTGNYDAYVNGDFGNAIATDIPFAGLSGDANGIVGENTVNFTAAGNSGAPLLDRLVTLPDGTRTSMILVGAPGSLGAIALLDNRRAEESIGKWRLVHAAINAGEVDVYITPPGNDITDLFPNVVQVTSLGATVYFRVAAGNYEIQITPTAEKTVIAGPYAVDFVADGIAELILLDTADPNVFTLTDWSN